MLWASQPQSPCPWTCLISAQSEAVGSGKRPPYFSFADLDLLMSLLAAISLATLTSMDDLVSALSTSAMVLYPQTWLISAQSEAAGRRKCPPDTPLADLDSGNRPPYFSFADLDR